ncbi:iron complex transport system permease protein (plasmid) [Azospirillum sp. B510]|uniref:FecCD family ABC transporter permease n=1 Tax=Azospirillum sp. (strain B510) TaxID=137722 RepID=UPI0001C4CDC9|nr:iron ABC transporter permease [Azospirillum sp. B510]BAI76463.1 iron complex transport system permease protein [Azospirillum sp. B510]
MASRPPSVLSSPAMLTAFLLLTSALLGVWGLLLGSRPLRPDALLPVLLHPNDAIDSILVWTLRLPRSLCAFVGGVGLAVSGLLLQILTRNPLAGPGLTGVTSGAVTAILLCFVLLPGFSSAYYPLVGLVGGLSAAAATAWIARGGGGGGGPMRLALGGISVALFLGAVTTYLILLSGPQSTSLFFWLSGGFQGGSWPQLLAMTPWVAIGLVGALACLRVVALFTLSEQAAAGMGLNLALWKPVLLLLAVLPVAGVAPVAGHVAFVGLAAPHIARLLKPPGPGWLIGLTAALGGTMVVAADLVARTIVLPREIPVSIVAALIGGPVFLHLVRRHRFSSGTGV